MALAMPEAQLDAVRRRGFGVAYRMLGTVSDAEDVAQEAVLRLTRSAEPVAEPAAWITTTATRLSLDVLRSARVRRERYVGPWLPEPLLEDAADDVAAHAELADTLSQAFLVLLERLSPLERAAFLLREAFDYDYADVARVIERSEANARQLVSRARKHLGDARPRFDADEAARDALLDRFLAATDDGDLAGLEALLAQHAVLYSDGGGNATAARKPLLGANRIARALVAMARRMRREFDLHRELTHVNGQPGLILRHGDGSVFSVMAIDVADGRIQAVRIMRNPDKLVHV